MAISLVKSFDEATVASGGTVTMSFELSRTDETGATATNVSFTDDLNNDFIPGATVSLPPSPNPPCGAGSSLVGTAGDSHIELQSGGLPPGGSCVFSMTVNIPAAASGAFTNTTSAISFDGGNGDLATADLNVISGGLFETSMEFTDDPVIPGDPVTLRFTLDNTAGTNDATSVAFTNDLSLILPGSPDVSLGALPASPCGGSLSNLGIFLIFAGGSVPAGTECSFDVPLNVPAAAPDGSFINTTGNVTALIDGTILDLGKMTDPLVVRGDTLITVDKSFAATTVPAGGTIGMTISLTNGSAADALENIAFSDDLNAFIPGATLASVDGDTCGGTPAGVGTTSLDYTGGVLAAGGSCAVTVTVQIPTDAPVTSHTNTTSDVTGNVEGLPVQVQGFNAPTAPGSLIGGAAASAQITVTPQQLVTFDKSFSGNGVFGSTVTLTFEIGNTAAGAVALTNLNFSDDLSGVLAGLEATNFPTNTCNGTISGTSSLSYTGGSLAAGASCQIEAVLQMPASGTPGTYPNTTSDLVSNGLPVAEPATADLIAVEEADLSIAITDGTDPVLTGGSQTFTVTVDNNGPSDATGAVVTMLLPTGMTLSSTSGCAEDPNGYPTCTLGSIAAGGSGMFTLDADIDPGVSGTLTTSGDVAGDQTDPDPDNDSASEDTTVEPSADIWVTKVADRNPATLGHELVYTITVSNAGPSDDPAVGISDVFDSNLTCTYTSVAGGGASGNTSAGSGDIADTVSMPVDGSVTYTATCQIDPAATDPLSNTVTATASVHDPDTDNNNATEETSLIQAPGPAFTKEFAPDTVNQGETSTLTFTIDNGNNVVDATNMAFTDTFPVGMRVASTPQVTGDCNGTVTAVALSDTVSLTGGQVDAGDQCTIAVTVQATGNGQLDNVSGDLTSSLMTSDGATATLTATAVPLELSMTFVPSTINQGEVSTLTISMRNVALIDATDVELTDILPTGVFIANPANASHSCAAGTLTAPAGGGTIQFDTGTVPTGQGCSITVDVTSTVVASHDNSTDTARSNLGDSTPAEATLIVEEQTDATVTFVQNSDTDGAYDFASTNPALTFLIEVNSGTGSQGPISVEAGSHLVTATMPEGVVLTEISCNDTDSSGVLNQTDAPRTGVLTLNLAEQEEVICTFTARSTTQQTIDTINRFLTKRADLILSTEPSRDRRINRLLNGFGNASPLTFSNGDLKSMLPFTAVVNRAGGSYSFSTSLLQMRQAAASVGLAHGSTKDVVYVPNYRWDAWFEAQYKEFDAGAEGEGHFAIAYMGADYLVSENLLVGLLAQFDTMEDRSTTFNSSASGTGWMIGPYMTARLGKNLFFDGRIAGGASSNQVSPFNTYTDDFDTTRWLAMASLSGEFQRGNWSVRPNASLSYFRETQDSYVDSAGATIPSQTVELGQLQIGPTFNGRFEGDNGQIYAPYFSVDAIYNIGNTSGVTVTNVDTPATEGWRARLKAGLRMTTETGVTLGFGATYDGIGRDDYEVWGLDFEFMIPLKKPKAR